MQFTRLTTVLLMSALLISTGCSTVRPSHNDDAWRQSNPKSILVLPPVNLSPDLRGSPTFLSTVTYPLAEAGYYVFPVAMVQQTFKDNGVLLPDEIHQTSLQKLYEVFGADAVLYITLEEYGNKFQIINSQTVVAAKARLVDGKNGGLLWEGKAQASSAETSNNSQGGLVQLIVSAAIQQIASQVGNPGREISHMTANRLLSPRAGGVRFGPRSNHFNQK